MHFDLKLFDKYVIRLYVMFRLQLRYNFQVFDRLIRYCVVMVPIFEIFQLMIFDLYHSFHSVYLESIYYVTTIIQYVKLYVTQSRNINTFPDYLYGFEKIRQRFIKILQIEGIYSEFLKNKRIIWFNLYCMFEKCFFLLMISS